MSAPHRNASTQALDRSDFGTNNASQFDMRARVCELYRAHSPVLLKQLTCRTGSRDIASELTHEIFVRLLRMSPAKLASIDCPDAYLGRIATNLLRDWARSRALGERSRNVLEISEGSIDQVTALESRDTLRRLEVAIGKLRPKTREIFLAQRVHGLGYAEIAARTGLSIKGVEKQMSRAIAKIDRLLDRG